MGAVKSRSETGNTGLSPGALGRTRGEVTTTRRNTVPISEELLDILACPKCKGSLDYDRENDGLVCPKDALVYPIKEDIPVMLVDQAVPLEEWKAGRREGKN